MIKLLIYAFNKHEHSYHDTVEFLADDIYIIEEYATRY